MLNKLDFHTNSEMTKKQALFFSLFLSKNFNVYSQKI